MKSRDLNLILADSAEGLRTARLPGLSKPLEEMTISELVQLRPGAEAADSYSINAFTDNVSVTTSSLVSQIGEIAKEKAMRNEVADVRLNSLRSEIRSRTVCGGSGD